MANPPQPKPPTEAELRQSLEEERAKSAKLEAEARGYLDAARSEWDRAEKAQAALRETVAGARRAAAPAAPDAFEKLAEGGIALSPEDQQRLLDQGTRTRAREEFGRGAEVLERRRLADEYKRDTRLALSFFNAQHPALAQDEEGFAAAMTKAQIRAGRQNLNLDPVGMLNFAHAIYQEGKGTADVIPFTEGAGAPGGPAVNPNRPSEPAPPSLWEKLYGAKDVVDESNTDWTIDGMTEKYLDQKNLELVKEGFTSRIGQIMGQIEEAKARRSAAA